MMNNKGRPLYVPNPQPPETVASVGAVHMDHDWRGRAVESL